jgi:hypothetical protein
MAKVKIVLEPGETERDADEAIQKALEFHTSGEAHDGEAFDDPAMVHMAQRLEEIHSRIYTEMVREISDALDEEYSHGSE